MLTEPARLEAAGLFAPFDIASRPAIVAAVSGGSDSTALLVLLKAFLDRRAPSTRLLAVTVDHRLRQSSRNEAEQVAALCRSLGVQHRIARWEEPKPMSGLPAAARLARYRLLAEAAHDAGSDLVLTGHTADDQAETVLMRQARGGGRGLAGMAPATLFRGRTWIARPFLATRRQALRDELLRRSIVWIDDPTNADKNFERPRLRADLSGRDGAVGQAIGAASQAAASRRELGERAARLIAAACAVAAAGPIRLAYGLLQSGDPDAAVYALRILLAVVGDTEQLPDLQRSAELWQRLASRPVRTAFSRCLVEGSGPDLLLLREPRGRAGPLPRLRLSPWADFLPSFDLAPARAAAELIGVPLPPRPPFAASSAGHIAG